jgi:hypothetical protein
MDWVCDEVLEFCFELIKKSEIKATFFVTHDTKVLDIFKRAGFDLGIHPNFDSHFEGTEKISTLEKIRSLKKFLPDAVCVRSHSLVRSQRLSALFIQEDFTHESNLFIPTQYGMKLLPYEQPKGLIQVGYNWGDYSWLSADKKISPDQYLDCPGLKVMNFHPIHLFLNTDDISVYNKAKEYIDDYQKLRKLVNKSGYGIMSYFEHIIQRAKEMEYTFGEVRQISVDNK